ncbi:MAG: hypothetical protein CMI90_06115 [Pelagibacteraceae bacterium]|nr:hypothetical protein [Pelagibacteraceae bacterium]|tara:strand:+ start:853 stop:1797 length:945 start_codon:yes stop_codon:yes gene_type:complete
MFKNVLGYIILSVFITISFVIGYEQISNYFNSNLLINGLIALTFIVGFLLYSFKVFTLFSEYRFMDSVAFGKLKISDQSLSNYPLTKSIALNLGIIGKSEIKNKSVDEILEELLSKIESGKDLSRYLINLAVFLGLIGTFFGLLLTIGSVANVIDGLSIEDQNFGNFFASLQSGLKSPLSGMTVAFTSSLFGLIVSLILGLYEIIVRGIKQSYYEYCEVQIRLYYKNRAHTQINSSISGGLDASQYAYMASINEQILEKLGTMVLGLDSIEKTIKTRDEKLVSDLKEVNKDLKDKVQDELRIVSKTISNLKDKK